MCVGPLRFLQLLCLHDQVFLQSQFQDNCLFAIIRANCKYNMSQGHWILLAEYELALQ